MRATQDGAAGTARASARSGYDLITIGANRLWVRKLRLVTGLTLFTYVTTHLLNHSLGNISIPAMEAGMVVQKWIWQGVAGTAALYFALSAHYLLGLWAFYERQAFSVGPGPKWCRSCWD